MSDHPKPPAKPDELAARFLENQRRLEELLRRLVELEAERRSDRERQARERPRR